MDAEGSRYLYIFQEIGNTQMIVEKNSLFSFDFESISDSWLTETLHREIRLSIQKIKIFKISLKQNACFIFTKSKPTITDQYFFSVGALPYFNSKYFQSSSLTPWAFERYFSHNLCFKNNYILYSNFVRKILCEKNFHDHWLMFKHAFIPELS